METQVTLTVPDKLYKRAQRIAQSREKDVADILLEAIVLEDVPDGEEGEGQAAIDREEAAWLRLHPWLRERYSGQYVALYNGKLVDRDEDQIALYERVQRRYPGKFIWIAQVKDTPIEEYVIRSPRLERDF